jgi:hypothetical protein
VRRAAALALVIVCAVLVALAVGAWRFPDRAAREDRLFTRVPPPERTWADAGDGPVALLLGASDDARFRHAGALYLRSRPTDPGFPKNAEQIVATVGAVAELRELERSAPHDRRRSAVLNLQAIALAEEAVFEPEGRTRVRRAADLLRRAVRLDPENDAAKANLELLLTLSRGPGATGEGAGGFGGFGKAPGAGGGGKGY